VGRRLYAIIQSMAIAAKATQEFVPIKEVRDGVVILKDGGMRSILLASSLNFALKSEENQNAIIMQFQNFLNSLDFSVQIFIESRKLDIRPYIALLEGRYKEQPTDLMRIQTREYIEFIKNFTENSSIMTKTFFLVIPYSPAILQGATLGFGKKQNKQSESEAKTERFEENKSQMEQRISVVEQGLLRCGIRVIQLGTEELVELFYKIFNPGDTEKPIQVN
jgi:type IV secretory pathway VirB4 component